MKNYQLELRQIVDFPRCRIYREFVQDLLTDRSIRTGGCSGLFYFVVLCSYANFRTSYRRIDGIRANGSAPSLTSRNGFVYAFTTRHLQS